MKFSTILAFLIPFVSYADWIVGLTRQPNAPDQALKFLHGAPYESARSDRSATLLRSLPLYLAEHAPASQEVYEEWIYTENQLPTDFGPALESFIKAQPVAMQNPETLRVLRNNGPSENRICLTILGDGYTVGERERFFDDAERLTQGLFESKAFASYLPLFNVYAVFVASKESGITDVVTRDTAFGLYRTPKGSKRGIMPGNTAALERALRLAPKTDFPIVVANDDFYGGLGGRYAITTRSETSGLVVLRHELGHNFGSVGEEYDNGFVYAGANASGQARNPPWAHWIETPDYVHEMKLVSGDYVWKNLSEGKYASSFQMPENKQNKFIFDGIISFVGWATTEDVSVRINGQPISMSGDHTIDRGFLKIPRIFDLDPGSHQIEIEERVKDGDNVLAFATLFAYPPGYDFSGATGSFATFDVNGEVSYRPTHDACLMRDITKDYFCSVDQENMWHKFLARISLVDKVTQTGSSAKLSTLALDGLSIGWFQKDGSTWKELTDLRDQHEATRLAPGSYKVTVSFDSREVRKKSKEFMDAKEFTVR